MSSVRPERAEARRQFEEEVLPAELEYVEDRRRRAVGDERPVDREALSTGNGLVGLALSGGGIRSASFGLGFLQSLGSRLFRRIDYMSTVSGGGFIGSSISALMANAFYRAQGSSQNDAGESDPSPAAFPFPLTRGEQESPALSHLRNNSNYMAPGGPGDLFRLLAVLVRGIILNSLSLAPFLLLICLTVLHVYGQQLSDRARFDDQVQRVDQLLGRYYGERLESDDEKAREIEPLLQVLEGEALLRVDAGKTRGDVIHGLRPALSFRRGSSAELISGNGTDAAPYRLAPGASRKELARSLLAGDLLQPNEVIEEIDLVARLLETDGYRHCRDAEGDEAEEGDCDDEEVDDDYVEALTAALHKRELVRTGTDEDALDGLLCESWGRRLKPILQTLYNAEYLSEEVLARLLREEADRQGLPRRPPYYAYGWYEARVGQPFPMSWHTDEYNTYELEERIASELERLTGALRLCAQGSGPGLPPFLFPAGIVEADPKRCLRPGTEPADILRLLDFEELGPAPAGARSVGRSAREDWPSLQAELGRLDEEGSLAEVVEVLYFAEYLDQEWVLEIVAHKAPWEPFYDDVLPGSDSKLLLDEFLVLERETVCADLVEVLRAKELLEEEECPSSDYIDDGDDEYSYAVLEAIWDLLDERWVNPLLYVYRYGWHRSLRGSAYPGTWCGSVPASRGEPDCPRVSAEAWGELSRALRDPSSWDPDRLRLPLTWVVIRAALGWVLLMPLVLLAARRIYRRRQREVAGEPNPLRALLSSDQSMNWRGLYERTFGVLLMAILGVALVELLPYAVHHFHYLNLRGQSSRTLAIGAVSLLVTALGGPALALLRRFGRTIALAVLAVAGPLFLLTLFVYAMEWAVYPPPPEADTMLGLFADRLLWSEDGGLRLLNETAAWLLFAVTSVAAIALALLIDINSTSLHGLYRDRIAKAFMVGLDTEGDVEPEEDLPLARICPQGSGAPYHLLNVALNLQGSGDRSLRGRNADSLFFSRDHVGGPRTGYCRTGQLARIFPHAHLAGAMAVSGAAVSPNMGRYKSGPLAVLMSLLNMRLALWMPHPGAVRGWLAGDVPLGLWRRLRLATPATLLLRELLGAIRDSGPVVNVSDGGHIENTGALELLRRRCHEIIVVDGEADPEMAFGGLANLQRIARLDMGIEIEIDLAALRPDEDGLSRRRSAVGTIHYPARRGSGRELAAETGRLLYLKLAVTGSEGETVAEYRARHREFPHQSTGDQAFSEGQLEAYRRLGQLAGEEAFGASEVWE